MKKPAKAKACSHQITLYGWEWFIFSSLSGRSTLNIRKERSKTVLILFWVAGSGRRDKNNNNSSNSFRFSMHLAKTYLTSELTWPIISGPNLKNVYFDCNFSIQMDTYSGFCFFKQYSCLENYEKKTSAQCFQLQHVLLLLEWNLRSSSHLWVWPSSGADDNKARDKLSNSLS